MWIRSGWGERSGWERSDLMNTLYDNLPQYLLISIVLVIVSIFVYIKLAFPFWNVQPVYHVYDFWRCLYSRPFRIYRDFHPKVKTKFCQPEMVDIVPFVDATDEQKKAFVNLIQCYSVGSEDAMCFFHLENLDAYFSGHVYGSYLSFYKEIYYTNREGEPVKGERPRGCISSRSGELVVRGHKENIYYIDFMTIDRNMTKSEKIYRELFETHIYKVGFVGWKTGSYDGKDIRVWLFRRSGVLLRGIVPTVRFVTREFEIPNNPKFFVRGDFPEDVVLVDIHGGNMRKMTDTLENIRARFSFFGITDEANLIGLIKAGVLYVYVLERLGDILAMYFFRDTRVQIEYELKNEKEMKGSILEVVAAVNIGVSTELFRGGFLKSVGSLVKKNSIYRRLRVDNLTDSGLLDWKEWYLVGEESGAYYVFNLIVPFSSSGSGVFLLF